MTAKTFILLFFVWAYWGQARAQEIPLGMWRTHACYQVGKQVAIGEEGIFCATANGIFLFDDQNNTYQTLTKQEGLSNANPSQIAYHTTRKTLILAYPDRTIDLLKDNEIIEIGLLRQASFVGNPQINQILPTSTFAYLATDFGVVVLDVGKEEIRETYRNLGINGAELAIIGLAFSRDSLALATAQGIIMGATSSNLADFQQWKRFTNANGLPTQRYKKIVSFQNNLFALGENNQLYTYTHLNVWQHIILPAKTFTDLQVGKDNKLYLLAENNLYTVEANNSLTEIVLPTPLPKAQSIQTKTNGAIWIADAQKGLLKVNTSGWTSHFPNSPASPHAWQVKYAEDKIVVTTGGFDNNLQPFQRTSGYATFAEGTWNSVALPAIKDLTAFTYVPQNKTRYFGSYGTGLWEQKEDGTLTQFTASNAPLIASALGDVRITALATDSEGKIWISNHAVGNGQTSLHTRQIDGTWRSFLPPSFAGRNPLDITIAQNKWKWVRLGSELGGGIWVLNDQNNQSRILNNTPNQGNLPSPIVNAIAEDKEGYMWVGTSRGIAVFYSPEQAFGNINALLPIYEGRPLLRDEVVTALVVDGGNRKWVGTTTGLWLFDAEGTKLIHYFNTANSPMPSNHVVNLALHPQTGELFVITDVGIISYRGTATEASTEFDNAQVFPNPVYPNFDGLVGISGLPTGAKVKITDVSGRLFYETVSQGGTASWNLQDYQGTRARAGIYLLYVFKADGSQTKVLKVAVLE